MNARATVLAGTLCAAFAGCALPPEAQPQPSAAPVPAADSGTYTSVLAGLTAELNRVRAEHGLPALRVDPALQRAATEYAAELAVRRVLSHDSPTPGRETMTQRIDAAGGRWRRAAENLALLSGAADEIPPRAIAQWLTSPSHRGNLLAPSYTHTGAGVARDTRGAWFIVQLYTLPPPRD